MAAESALEKKLVAWAKTQGILTYKFVSPGARGVPDRLFIVEGHHVFIEFKSPGKKPTKLQCREITRIHEAGGCAVWRDNFQAAKRTLQFYQSNPQYD